MSPMPTEVHVRLPVRLGQLLQLAGAAESGAQARELLADGNVRVDGDVETRRGRQLRGEEVLEVRGPGGVEVLRVVGG